MLIQHLLYNDLNIINQSTYTKVIIGNSLKKTQKKVNTIDMIHSFSIFLIAQNDTSINANHQITKLTNKKLMPRHFIMHLINKYWQETIFISRSDVISDYYTNRLKSDGIAVYKNQYKKFLLEFSKALVTGRIQVSLDDSKDLSMLNSSNTDIKYIWRKSVNFSLPRNILSIFMNKRQQNFPLKSQQSLINILRSNRFPLFTITNNFNQIVIAEPSDELIKKQNIVDYIYQWYSDNFIWEKDQKPVYEGLFFVNPEDALEYNQYITSKYFNTSNQKNFNIFASSLDFYYKLVRLSPPRLNFRLIPDLKELGDLLYKYQFNNNIHFHANQKYGKYYFQGQPIYLIKPTMARNKKTKQLEKINYTYKLIDSIKEEQYDAVFMNYKVALLAWRKFIKNNINYNLPYKPQVLVYNLEDFLKTQERNMNISRSSIILIPNKDSYEYIKLNNIKKSEYKISRVILNKFLSLKIIIKRVVWSLTSRQPVNQ